MLIKVDPYFPLTTGQENLVNLGIAICPSAGFHVLDSGPSYIAMTAPPETGTRSNMHTAVSCLFPTTSLFMLVMVVICLVLRAFTVASYGSSIVDKILNAHVALSVHSRTVVVVMQLSRTKAASRSLALWLCRRRALNGPALWLYR